MTESNIACHKRENAVTQVSPFFTFKQKTSEVRTTKEVAGERMCERRKEGNVL